MRHCLDILRFKRIKSFEFDPVHNGNSLKNYVKGFCSSIKDVSNSDLVDSTRKCISYDKKLYSFKIEQRSMV